MPPTSWSPIRDDRVFYTDAMPPATGTVGRPRRHGDRFRLADPNTWPTPDVESTTTDLRYGTVKVSAWHGLHPRLGCRGHWAEHDIAPIVAGTLIRVEVEHLPKPTSATKKTLWLWAAGPGFNLDTCWRGYLRRFDIEHTFRFLKNTLGWTTPALRTPEQADRWTWLVLAAYTQLRLARDLVDDLRLPWERQRKPGRPPPAPEERFDDLPQHWAPQPVHQNPEPPAQDAPKEPAESDEPAIQRSRRPHSQRQPGISDSLSRRTLTCLHRKRWRTGTVDPVIESTPRPSPTRTCGHRSWCSLWRQWWGPASSPWWSYYVVGVVEAGSAAPWPPCAATDSGCHWFQVASRDS